MLGLLHEDGEWSHAIDEMAEILIGDALIKFFVMVLVFGEPDNPSLMFVRHFDALTIDFRRRSVSFSHLYFLYFI